MADPLHRLTKARHLLAVGRADEAKRLLGEALAEQPDDPELHLAMAEAHRAAGEIDDALAAARRSLAIDPSVPALHVAAVAHRQLGEFDESLALIDRALSERADSARLHVGRALTLAGPWLLWWPDLDRTVDDADRRLTAAHHSCDRAAALDPEMAVVPYARAVIALGRDDLPAAANHLTDTLRLDAELAAAHLLLGRVRARQGMGRLASRHFADAGRLDPSQDAPRLWLRALGRPFSRRARRRGRVDTARLVPEAQRIVEADLKVRSVPT